jgi:hypothetical protein
LIWSTEDPILRQLYGIAAIDPAQPSPTQRTAHEQEVIVATSHRL